MEQWSVGLLRLRRITLVEAGRILASNQTAINCRLNIPILTAEEADARQDEISLDEIERITI